ncbi:MAG: sulfatase-like hydrolase/transferase [Chloroflexota bacterium]
MKKPAHTLLVCLCIAALLACNAPTSIAPTFAPSQTPTPTLTATPTDTPTPTSTPTPTPPFRPNIVYILADDMTYADLQFMPKTMELLGKGGMSFEQFFVSMSLCCPSRVCFLRGQYPHNTQITGNTDPDGGFNKFHDLGLENSTVAVWLQQAGYQTALFGKYLNGYPGAAGREYIPPGWSEWYSSVRGDAYQEYNYTLNQNGQLVDYAHEPDDYGTDVYARLAADFIARKSQTGEPFFAYVSVYAPHGPATPAPRHTGLFQDLSLPRPPSFNEEDIGDKPAYINVNEPLAEDQIRRLERTYRQRARSLQAVDEMVANLVAQLESLGQLEDTYIFFTSDNGYHLGEHRLPQGKNTPYEEDIRVPLLVLGPDIEAGAVVDALAGNIDLAPTFAELAGIAPPDFVDGRSLVPFWRNVGRVDNPPYEWREAFLLERGPQTGFASVNFSSTPPALGLEQPDSPLDIGPAPNYVGIRTADYTYVEYATGEVELYDLHNDPYQLQNIVRSADPSLLAMLHAWLEALRQCAAESCRSAEIQP